MRTEQIKKIKEIQGLYELWILNDMLNIPTVHKNKTEPQSCEPFSGSVISEFQM